MAAKSKEVEVVSLDDINCDISNTLEFIEIEEAEVKTAGDKIFDEGQGAELIFNKLKELKVI